MAEEFIQYEMGYSGVACLLKNADVCGVDSVREPHQAVSVIIAVLHFWKRLIEIYHQSLMQTEKSQPEGKRIMPETRISGIIRLPSGWNFSVCIGDRSLIIFLIYDIKDY